MQFEIGIDPNLAEIGPFAISWHGLLTVLAIIVAVLVTEREFRRRAIPLVNFDMVVLWTVLGGILGARVFHIIDRFDYYAQNPEKILAFQEGGLAIYGAVIGGFIAVAIVSRFYRLPFAAMTDAIAPGLLLAQAIGRLGCLVNGDAWGAPTSSSWPFAVVYTHPDALLPNDLLGVPTHPYPIYDMVLNLAIFGIIWQLRKRPLPSGALFATFTVLYAIARFFVSYVRQEQVWFWGLQEAQVIAIAMLVLGGGALIWLLRRGAPAPARQASS